MRARKAALVIAVVASGLLTGCGGRGGAYYDTLCVNPATQVRMDYTYCTANPAWVYYVPYGYSYPSYGGRVTNYTVNNYHRPAGTIHTGSLPSTAGKASKYSTGNTKVKPATKPNRQPQRQAPKFKSPPKVYVRK